MQQVLYSLQLPTFLFHFSGFPWPVACICISLVSSALDPILPRYDLTFISSSAESLQTALGRALSKHSASWTTFASGLLPKACIEGWAMTSAHFFYQSPYPGILPAEAMLPMAKSQHSSKLTSLAGLWSLGEFCYVTQAQPLGILWRALLVYPFFSWASFLGPDPAWSQHPCFPTLNSATKSPECQPTRSSLPAHKTKG